MPRVGSLRMNSLGFSGRPSCKQHLLLIAAGKSGHALTQSRGGDVQAATPGFGTFPSLSLVDPSDRGQIIQAGQGQVLGDPLGRDEPFAAAVGWDIGNARSAAIPRDGAAGTGDSSRQSGRMPSGATPNRRPDSSSCPAPARPVRPDDLAGACLKIHALESSPSDARDAEQWSGGHLAGRTPAYINGLADHGRHQRRQSDLSGLPGSRVAAVAKHRDPVGDLEDFLKMMGDVQNTQSAGAEGPQNLEELVSLSTGKSRGRLIEDEDASLTPDCLGDLDLLPLADRQAADLCPRHRDRTEARQEDDEPAGQSRAG